jgi:hypothetical protein
VQTFSQMVDEMAAETRRPDILTDIARFANQTIRELHFSVDKRAAQFFRSNFKELELTTIAESGYVWDIPNPDIFQALSAVKYPEAFDFNGDPLWAKEMRPGVRQNATDAYWYRAGESIAFSGYGAAGAAILVGYYEFPKSLKYFAEADRPASYDLVDGWTYHDDYDADDDTKLAARELVSNWLLFRWQDVVSEGLRAKVFKRVSDEARGKLAYSAYESLRQGLWTSETTQLYGG